MRITISLLVLLSAQNGRAAALALPARNDAPPSIAVSAPPPTTPQVLTPSMIYNASNLRDPFRKASSGSSLPQKAFKISNFNIHNLDLRGLMRDSKSSYALLIDTSYGISFILKGGKLYGPQGKPIPGISGHLDEKRKTVYLKAQEGDVQVLRMGGKIGK